MYRVAVVGPKQSVDRILTLASKIEKELIFVPYIYNKTSEVKAFVQDPKAPVDFWLFSGYIPYKIAVNATGASETYVHIDSSELSIYKGLVELSMSVGKMPMRISVDIIDAFFYEEEFLQLEKSLGKLYMKKFDVDIKEDSLFDFHYELWKQNKTEAAFTCYPNVHESLREEGVPAFLLSPSRNEISHTIRIFFEKIKTTYYKDMQISVAVIEVVDYDAIQEKMKETYRLEYLKLHLKKTLLQLCERLDGSLFEEGSGRYAIFSTRGAIERETGMLKEKVNHLSVEADSSVAVGIGYGQTVFTAEANAYRAIRESKMNEAYDIVMIQEDGTKIESVGEEEELVYAYRTDDEQVLKKLKEGNISVNTFKRLESLVRKMDWTDFTTKDLALHLKMSDRNAQRIVSDLCKVNLADCIGKESYNVKGRPMNVYRLTP